MKIQQRTLLWTRHSWPIKINIGNQSIQLISIAGCYRLISVIILVTINNLQKNFFIDCYQLAKIDNNYSCLQEYDLLSIYNHSNYSKMALLLHKIIPGTIRDIHPQQATRLYHFSFWPITKSIFIFVSKCK